jgi:hypothetical protein
LPLSSMNLWSPNFFVNIFHCKIWTLTSARSRRWKNNFFHHITDFFKRIIDIIW